jgi:BTB/POZ domain-containing protein KCTD9
MSTAWLWLLGAVGILYLVKVAIVMIPKLMVRRSRRKPFMMLPRVMSQLSGPKFSDILATITEYPLATAFLALVVSGALVLGLTKLFFGYDRPFFENIMVEAHGMLLDILVIGLFILWLNKLGEKRLENRRYHEEIDDFRYWHSEEAAYRIAGTIKRLNRNGVSSINLAYCYLARIILYEANLEDADLGDANFEGTVLGRANLEGAFLGRANLKGADLAWANLKGADLMDANLKGAILGGANLKGANLEGANLEGATLVFTYLGGTNFRGANLKDTALAAANLEGAALQESKNLTEEQVQSARINKHTMLPDYLKRLRPAEPDDAAASQAGTTPPE